MVHKRLFRLLRQSNMSSPMSPAFGGFWGVSEIIRSFLSFGVIVTLLLFLGCVKSTEKDSAESGWFCIRDTKILSLQDSGKILCTITAGDPIGYYPEESSDTVVVIKKDSYKGRLKREDIFKPQSSLAVLQHTLLHSFTDTNYLKPLPIVAASSDSITLLLLKDTVTYPKGKRPSKMKLRKHSSSNSGFRASRSPLQLKKMMPRYYRDEFSTSLKHACTSALLLDRIRTLGTVRKREKQKRLTVISYRNQLHRFKDLKNPVITGSSIGDLPVGSTLLWKGEEISLTPSLNYLYHHPKQRFITYYKVYRQFDDSSVANLKKMGLFDLVRKEGWVDERYLIESKGKGLYTHRENDFKYPLYITEEAPESVTVVSQWEEKRTIHKDQVIRDSETVKEVNSFLKRLQSDSTFTYDSAQHYLKNLNVKDDPLINDITRKLFDTNTTSNLPKFYEPLVNNSKEKYKEIIGKLESKGDVYHEYLPAVWPDWYSPLWSDNAHSVHHKEFLKDFYQLVNMLPKQRTSNLFTYLSNGISLFTDTSQIPFKKFSPKAINWIHNNLIPTKIYNGWVGSNQNFFTLYQDRYAHFIRETALAYQLLFRNRSQENDTDLQKDILHEFAQYVVIQDVPAEEFFDLFRAKDSLYNKSEIPPANQYLAFWCRRALDGSADEIWSLLTTILTRFDNEWYQQNISSFTPDTITYRGDDVFSIYKKGIKNYKPSTPLVPFSKFRVQREPFHRRQYYLRVQKERKTKERKDKKKFIFTHKEKGFGTYAFEKDSSSWRLIRLQKGVITYSYQPVKAAPLDDLVSIEFSPGKRWITFRDSNEKIYLLDSKTLIEKQLRNEILERSGLLNTIQFHHNDSLVEIGGGCLCEGEEGRTTYFEHLYRSTHKSYNWSTTGEVHYSPYDSLIRVLKRPTVLSPIDTVRLINGFSFKEIYNWKLSVDKKVVIDVCDISYDGYTVALRNGDTLEIWQKGFSDEKLLFSKEIKGGFMGGGHTYFTGERAINVATMEAEEIILKY